ncbi:helix-turn-helix transcriptional regulator [Streptacidiphilus sp. 4-A2]|nr:helix-turn-helix transcriptional regulator [Streptacidiphilus sp. 4-A2]
MDDPVSYRQCVLCLKRFTQRSGPGRKRLYCTVACRRRAQRQRDGQRAVAPLAGADKWGMDLASSIQMLAERLAAAEQSQLGLGARLGYAEQLRVELGYYAAAAVHEARVFGDSWADVALAAGVSADTARERWSEGRVRRLMDRRSSQPARVRGSGGRVGGKVVQPRGGSVLGLAGALSFLLRRSELTMHEVAQQAGVSASFVSRILTGERVPSWQVAHMLASVLGGDPEDLRFLWESAQGLVGCPRQPLEQAVARLHAAVRGLYLAAGRPDLRRLCSRAQGGITADLAQAVLAGACVPDWRATAALAAGLGGRAGAQAAVGGRPLRLPGLRAHVPLRWSAAWGPARAAPVRGRGPRRVRGTRYVIADAGQEGGGRGKQYWGDTD